MKIFLSYFIKEIISQQNPSFHFKIHPVIHLLLLFKLRDDVFLIAKLSNLKITEIIKDFFTLRYEKEISQQNASLRFKIHQVIHLLFFFKLGDDFFKLQNAPI